MISSITWVHVGDLHLDEASDWQSLTRLQTIISQVNEQIGAQADFVYLPGDNANHGTTDQYAALAEALSRLERPWRIIPGDHDFEPGNLAAYEVAIPEVSRPEVEVIAGHRCIFLDIVSAGAGGPDFRLTMHHRNRIAEEIAEARAGGQVPLNFMHAYLGVLAADGDEVAKLFADGGVAFVDTGHTHCSELLNDGRVIYGATRSTGEIEEDSGRPGFSIVCVHDGVPSWRFRRLDAEWPHVQIIAPCDVRLITQPAAASQVPRPGSVSIVARVFGAARDAEVSVRVDDDPEEYLWLVEGVWRADVPISSGLHRVTVSCGDSFDQVDVLVRDSDAIPKRRLPVALGRDCHAIGAWPIAGLEGTQLGPNKNGKGW